MGRAGTVFMLALAGTACGAESEHSASDPSPSSDEACYSPVASAAAVSECAATELCLPPALDVTIDSSSCTAPSCRFTYQENAGPTLTYEDGSTFVFLRFLAPIGGATTSEELLAVFDHVNFYVSFPVEGLGGDAIYFEQRVGSDAFETFELENGELHVKLAFTVSMPYAWIYSSDDPNCVSADVSGMCTCPYDVPNPSASVEVELPAEIR